MIPSWSSFLKIPSLLLYIQGDSDGYNELVGLMHGLGQVVGLMHHNEGLSPDVIAFQVSALKTLRSAVSCIDIVHHRSLLEAAPLNSNFLHLCLDMLVCDFVPPGYLLASLKWPRDVKKKNQVLDRVHSTLKAILGLQGASAAFILEKIVIQRMPTKYMESQIIVMYVENMPRLESGTMGELVGRSMLAGVVDMLVELDAAIVWDDILQDDLTKGIFDMELDNYLEGPQDDFECDGDQPCRENWIQKVLGGNLMAGKLDSLMVVTFEHLKLSNSNGRLHLVFGILLQSFMEKVLTTDKPKFGQFVIFYMCSLDPDNCGQQFAITLLNTFLSSSCPPKRMSAVAYLASYLSHAMFVSTPLVVHLLERLVNWCSDYCKNHDGHSNQRPRKEFYTACQVLLCHLDSGQFDDQLSPICRAFYVAFMYVLCFRTRSIISVPRLGSKLVLMRIDEILKHPLNPLKKCCQSVVGEFLSAARSSRLFTVPENLVIVESELARAFGNEEERPDMFFPFDPCLLKKSDRFIRPNFVYWSMVRHPYDIQDDDNDVDSSDKDAAEVTTRGNRMMLDDDDDDD
ncbi:OLC1v1027702C1 [Oldenlandia corymbosa var. corymbosa]|uniref:OLC1v1027702C1 n=1 Tax=Oldenlandia corymbosa var. corymbosa TaxID=529605 RepID=A0AAV1CDA0_OLDCO|nr:OLC1v1027702C1 [Oldenlandia corymbosa var. corymbosa]